MGGEPLAHRVGQAWRGGLLDDLLVTPLHRAVALAERDDRAVPVAEHLHLHMARLGEVALAEHRAVAERRLGLAGCAVERVREILGSLHDAHAAAAATRRRLDEQREAELLRLPGRQRRDARSVGDALRLELVASAPERVRRRADPREARLLDRLGERGALGEEPVAGMDERCACIPRGGHERVGVEVGGDLDGLVRGPRVQGVLVAGADGRDRADAEPPARREDAHRDLSAVRDEELPAGAHRARAYLGEQDDEERPEGERRAAGAEEQHPGVREHGVRAVGERAVDRTGAQRAEPEHRERRDRVPGAERDVRPGRARR